MVTTSLPCSVGSEGLMGFAAEQLTHVRARWQEMLDHPFLLRTRDGTIPFDTFATWIRQDFLFVEAAIPFVSILLAKAPAEHRDAHTRVLGMLNKELELFRERARAVGVDLGDLAPSFVNHAYIQFLLATAYRESYACGYTVLYVAEKAYHDSWRVVLNGIDRASPWFPFVENWAGVAFGAYVAHLEQQLDELAGRAGAAERARMAELFELTLRYEIAYWEMAWTAADWPRASAADVRG
jgi:thiaminase/transcriptional activator TenA